MSLGGGDQEVTQSTEPWGALQGPLRELYGMTDNALGNLQGYYPYQTYANLTPLQEASQYGAMDYAQNYYMPAAMGFQQQLGQYMDAPLNISQDPAVQAMMAANQGEVTDWLRETAIPATTTSAVRSGGLGGSRQGIAQGQAVGRAADALSRANAQTMLGAYGTASNLAGNAANMFGNALNMGFTPSQIAGNIGGQYQGLVNQGINESMTRYGYPESNLWNRLTNAANIYQGGGTYNTSTGTQPGADPLSNILGTGLTAYGLFGGGLGTAGTLGALAGGGTMAGTLGGSLLASGAGAAAGGSVPLAAFLAASDRRLKKNIKPIEMDSPYQWYEFEYIDPEEGEGVKVGVMADEVEKINPAAVSIRDDGYKVVNYAAL